MLKKSNDLLRLENNNWLKRELKAIDGALTPHIRFRNKRVHEWGENHLRLHFFSMVDLLANVGKEPFASNVKDHFKDTKFDIRREADNAIDACYDCYFRIVDCTPETVHPNVNRYNELCDGVYSAKTRMSVI